MHDGFPDAAVLDICVPAHPDHASPVQRLTWSDSYSSLALIRLLVNCPRPLCTACRLYRLYRLSRPPP